MVLLNNQGLILQKQGLEILDGTRSWLASPQRNNNLFLCLAVSLSALDLHFLMLSD